MLSQIMYSGKSKASRSGYGQRARYYVRTASAAASAIQRAWQNYRRGSVASAQSALQRGMRKRMPATLTRSVKAPIPQGRVLNEGTGGQCSYFTGMKGKSFLPESVLKTLRVHALQSNAASQLKSVVGKQAASVPLFLNAGSLASTLMSDSISQVIYDKAYGDVTLNNIYLSNCYIIIYDCIARHDIGNSAVSSPLLAWTQGDSDEGTSNAYSYLGSTPWQSEAFNAFWKVAQTTKVVLGAGATHVHHIRLDPKKIVSGAYAAYCPNGMAGLLYACMIEIHGSPANDSVTQTQVGVGVAGLNIVADYEHHLKILANNSPNIEVNNTLISSFTNGEQVVNLGGSTIVAQAEG